MQLGVSYWPLNTTWPSLRDIGVLADRGGLDMLFTWDHFDAISGKRENPNLECFSVLAGWAALTERIRLGPLVAGVTYRHPAVLTKIVTALDHISGGRAIMGLGAAWFQPEHAAFGIELGTRKERSDRFAEATRIVRAMLREGTATYSGKHYTVKDALNVPRPLQSAMSILIGGGGEQRTLRTTARYADMWHGFGSADDLAAKIEVLRAHCARVGRDPSEILVLGGGWVVIRDHADDARAYLESVASHHGISAPIPRAVGDPDAVAQALYAYWKAGVRGFILSGAEPFDRETIERLVPEVRPRLTRLIEG